MSARVMRRGAGFSLVELMVALVIGLLALMFATRVVLTGEQNKKASLGGSDAMQNGMVGMFSMQSDIGQAGFGINDPILVGCNTRFIDANGYTLASVSRGGAPITPLAAVVIQENTAGSDQVSVYSGSSLTGTGSLVISQYAGGTIINVASVPYGFGLNDVLVAAPDVAADGSQCAITQITTNPAALAPPPAQQSVSIGGSGRFTNRDLFSQPFPAGRSRVFNLGPSTSLSFHTWSVANGFLMLRATELAGAELRPSSVIDNVVTLKAQYGFDIRTGTAFQPNAGLVVGRWSASMIDADGDGVVGGHADYQHIAAIRLAVVARSQSPDKPNPAGVCTTTAVKPTLFASASPQGVTAVPVTAEVAVTGDPTDWKCYSYRVFETIVPLRNAGWRP